MVLRWPRRNAVALLGRFPIRKFCLVPAECFIAAGRQCVARSFALSSCAHFVSRGGGPRDLLGSTTLTDQVTHTYGRIVIITVHDVPCVCIAGRFSLFDQKSRFWGFLTFKCG